MNRSENIAYIKLHKMLSDSTIHSQQLKIDCRSQKVIGQIPIVADPQPIYTKFFKVDDDQQFNFNSNFNFTDSSIRVIKIGGVEDLNPLKVATEISTIFHDPDTKNPAVIAEATVSNNGNQAPPKRESKVPNIPMMIRCQNCDTNFPTKYQFQRHQCEFNADKVVLKPNVDAKDIDKGVRMKYDCDTCGKQFVSKNNLERHLTSHDEDNVNICEFCNKQFVSENRLRIHKENHCKKAGDISKFYRSDVTVWKCTKCFQVFSSDIFANLHADVCTDVTDPVAIQDANVDDVPVLSVVKTEVFSEMAEEACSPINLSTTGNKYVVKIRTELLLQCEFCNRTYANVKSLLWHQDTHTTSINYNCDICNEIFESYVAAAKHWLTNCSHAANLFYLPKLIYCKCCDRTFKAHEILYLHKIKKKHYCAKRHIAMEDEVPEPSPVPEFISGEPYICTTEPIGGPPPKKIRIGEPSSEKPENKETIIKLIEGVLCSIKQKMNTDNDDELELMKDSAEDCDEELIELDNDNDKDNDNENLCIKSEVVSQSSLLISEEAPEEKVATKKKRGRKKKPVVQSNKGKKCVSNVDPGYKYQCERCIKVFDSVHDMEMHRNKEHPANYKCDVCDQVVHSSKALIIHSRAHQSLKPYVCEICKRCYSQTSHLWQHMRFHQGIKPFACPHEGCEARYTIRPDLKDHIRKVHTRERPFKCSVCDKCFLTGSVYYQHRLIHTNDRRYACDICNKRFFRADALNNHRRIHTDERPYPCNNCGRHFRQKGDRNKHVRTQHPECQI